MDVQTAIQKRRTVRRFTQQPIPEETVTRLVDLSRLYASGANLQPIRYYGVVSQTLRSQIFADLRWAAYLPGFEILPEQQPTAYVVLACSPQAKRSSQFDVGAAATTLMLAAEGEGIASCCLGSFSSDRIAELLNLSDDLVPALVIALGYPDQVSHAVDLVEDVKYYEDSDGTLCVPKRKLDTIFTLL